MLRNAGSAVGATSASLRSNSAHLEVIDGTGAFGAAGENDTTVSTADWFRVRALPDAPVEEPAHCDLLLSGAGYEDTIRIPIVIGDSMNLPAGPDVYGYRIFDYTDSCYAQRPDYEWIEIRDVGTRLLLGDDETKVIDLPRSFGAWRYYGRDYTRLSVCSNGFIAADSTDRCDFRDVILPYTGAPPNIVAFLWDNLDPSQGGAVWFRHDTAGHRLIVEFDSVPYFAVGGQWERVQVHLYDRTVPTPTGDNAIVAQYQTMNYPAAPSVGLQNGDGTMGLCHVYNNWYPRVSAPLRPFTAIRMEPVQMTGAEEPRAAVPGRAPVLSVEPSPCRGTASIRFLPAGGEHAAIRVFSSNGRLVRALAGRSPLDNRHFPISISWDGCDASGVKVAPGLYFVRAGSASAKLTVVR